MAAAAALRDQTRRITRKKSMIKYTLAKITTIAVNHTILRDTLQSVWLARDDLAIVVFVDVALAVVSLLFFLPLRNVGNCSPGIR